ncbi:T6SS immunity protein Tli4 family protein [Massilia arenae]|uniref:Tle cognate immunity protein 4 C-terminal domain-containing protein n=1 Tax=Massilia arenae TaxID=2603288 RepID=A0A5C7G0G5_9BURK|nr:T6SS immunity protein Tli4 family protein [Massilia arenae]TXF96644.1 hypothetical protein FVD38_23750 [Massilia arenae]
MRIAFLLISLMISGCVKEKSEKIDMNGFEKDPIPYCAGRLFLAVPSILVPESLTIGSFKFSGLRAEDPSIDVFVEEIGMNECQFNKKIQQRSVELKSAGDETTNILKHEKRLADDLYLFRVQEIDDAYISEVLAVKGSNLVTVKMHSFRNQFDAAENQLIRLVKGVIVGGAAVKEGGQGFCLGSVVVTGDFQEESGRFLYRSPNGINVNLIVDTYSPDERISLHGRVSGSESLLARFSVKHKVLRERERIVAGMKAQEWLSWAEIGPSEGQGAYGFAVETMRMKPQKLSPSLYLSMDTSQPLADGTPTTTSMSDGEVIGLWDSIVNSIRVAAHSTSEK